MNPAAERMFGFSREEMQGRLLHDMIHHHRPDGTPLPWDECTASRAFAASSVGREEVFFRKDGSPVDVSCSNAPISQGGRAGGAVAVIRDVSERKRAEERLRQSQKLESIGLLAGGIAHDFNNILTTIIGAAKLIEEDVPPSAAGFLQSILDGADNAANLTRQLLAYAGKGRFVIQKLDVPAIVRAMAGLIRLSLPKTTELRFDLPEGLPKISGDPGQVQQVAMNLVLNASEAIQPETGGMVSVSAGVEEVAEAFVDDAGSQVDPGLYIRLEVADNGAGIDEQTRARIFDPFFTTKFTGRGLGLAAVSGITRSQKGAITITSAPGQGSTFRVLFPVR
jgi:PAS domain S-box-containing protein